MSDDLVYWIRKDGEPEKWISCGRSGPTGTAKLRKEEEEEY